MNLFTQFWQNPIDDLICLKWLSNSLIYGNQRPRKLFIKKIKTAWIYDNVYWQKNLLTVVEFTYNNLHFFGGRGNKERQAKKNRKRVCIYVIGSQNYAKSNATIKSKKIDRIASLRYYRSEVGILEEMSWRSILTYKT